MARLEHPPNPAFWVGVEWGWGWGGGGPGNLVKFPERRRGGWRRFEGVEGWQDGKGEGGLEKAGLEGEGAPPEWCKV